MVYDDDKHLDPDIVHSQGGVIVKLLYAEDEPALSEAVVDYLTYHKYIVDAVYDGADGHVPWSPSPLPIRKNNEQIRAGQTHLIL